MLILVCSSFANFGKHPLVIESPLSLPASNHPQIAFAETAVDLTETSLGSQFNIVSLAGRQQESQLQPLQDASFRFVSLAEF